MTRSLVENALEYAAIGWPVFPLKSKGKMPLTVRGFKDACSDPATIKAWWLRWPDANIGVPTGAVSGLAVIDIDPRHGGDVSLERLIGEHGPLPDTLESHTGGGGRHLCFAFVEGFRNSAGDVAPGIDTRGEGGYIVIPPSVHESGNSYEWEGGEWPDPAKLAPLPDWLMPGRNKIKLAPDGSGNLNFDASKVSVKANGKPVAPGGRNMAAASLAGQFIAEGDSVTSTLAKVRAWNSANPVPLPVNEIDRTVASVALAVN